jgi:hypothetical protein
VGEWTTGCDIAGRYIQFPDIRASSGSDEGSPHAANPHAASRGTDSAVWFGLVLSSRGGVVALVIVISLVLRCWSL